MQQSVTLGEGAQTIRLIPTLPIEGGGLLLATSAAFQIFHFDGDEDQPSAAATVDSASETLTAGVGTGEVSRRIVEVADTSGMREGGYYALTNATGERLLIQAQRIVSATQIKTASNVRGAFPIGSTIRGVEIEAEVPAVIADDEDHTRHRFLIEWSVTHPDGVETFRELLQVLSAVAGNLALTTDVERLDGTAANLNNRRDKVEKCLAQAHEDFWRKAQNRGIVKDGFHPGANGKAWVTYRAAYLLRVEMGQERDMTVAEMHKAEYDQIMTDLTSGSDVAIVDRDDEPDGLSDVDGQLEVWDLC